MAPEFRRSEPRFRAINLVSIQQLDEAGTPVNEGVGRTLDLSLHGMLLELSQPFEQGVSVELSFALGDRVVEVSAEVRSVTEVAEEKYAIGLKYDDLAAEDGEAIDAYLDARK